MKIESGLRQIPRGHAAGRSMWAFKKVMTDGKAGHLFNHADPAMLSHANMSTPVVEQFKRALVFLTDRDGILSAVTHYGIPLEGGT